MILADLERVPLDAMPGNVMRSHGRDHVRLLGLRFSTAAASERAFVRTLPVTSAAEQAAATERFRAGGGNGELFACVYLAASAYRRCGISATGTPGDLAFQLGMIHASRHRLRDPAPETWEVPYRGVTDLAVQLAHDDDDALDAACARLAAEANAAGLAITFVERGTTLRDAAGRPVEAFGFVDGISQPPIASFADLRTFALVPDPGHIGGWGSYVVYRKLRQERGTFAHAVATLAAAAAVDEPRAAALLIGRARDGTPAHFSADEARAAPANNFTYERDSQGRGCPMAAHARRMNPRDDGGRWHQLIRRGVPYDDGHEVGLLFLAYQQDVTRQFEFLQGVWGAGRDGIADPLLGGERGVGFRYWRGVAPIGVHIPELTRLRGGAYWFAPCPQALAAWPS